MYLSTADPRSFELVASGASAPRDVDILEGVWTRSGIRLSYDGLTTLTIAANTIEIIYLEYHGSGAPGSGGGAYITVEQGGVATVEALLDNDTNDTYYELGRAYTDTSALIGLDESWQGGNIETGGIGGDIRWAMVVNSLDACALDVGAGLIDRNGIHAIHSAESAIKYLDASGNEVAIPNSAGSYVVIALLMPSNTYEDPTIVPSSSCKILALDGSSAISSANDTTFHGTLFLIGTFDVVDSGGAVYIIDIDSIDQKQLSDISDGMMVLDTDSWGNGTSNEYLAWVQDKHSVITDTYGLRKTIERNPDSSLHAGTLQLVNVDTVENSGLGMAYFEAGAETPVDGELKWMMVDSNRNAPTQKTLEILAGTPDTFQLYDANEALATYPFPIMDTADDRTLKWVHFDAHVAATPNSSLRLLSATGPVEVYGFSGASANKAFYKDWNTPASGYWDWPAVWESVNQAGNDSFITDVRLLSTGTPASHSTAQISLETMVRGIAVTLNPATIDVGALSRGVYDSSPGGPGWDGGGGAGGIGSIDVPVTIHPDDLVGQLAHGDLSDMPAVALGDNTDHNVQYWVKAAGTSECFGTSIGKTDAITVINLTDQQLRGETDGVTLDWEEAELLGAATWTVNVGTIFDVADTTVAGTGVGALVVSAGGMYAAAGVYADKGGANSAVRGVGSISYFNLGDGASYITEYAGVFSGKLVGDQYCTDIATTVYFGANLQDGTDYVFAGGIFINESSVWEVLTIQAKAASGAAGDPTGIPQDVVVMGRIRT